MTEHPGEQFPPDVDPDVEPGFDPYPPEETPQAPDYDTEPAPQTVTPEQPHATTADQPYGGTADEPVAEEVRTYGGNTAEQSYGGAAADQSHGQASGDSYDGVADEPAVGTEAVHTYGGGSTEQSYDVGAAEQPDGEEAGRVAGEAYGEGAEEVDTEAVFEASLGEVSAAEGEAEVDTDAGGELVGGHVDPAEVEFGPEFARAPGEEHEHSFVAESAAAEPGVGEQEVADESGSEDSVNDSGDDDPTADAVPGFAAAEVPDEERAHPLVEETMGRLDELRDRPVGEHVEVYADLHERLQSALVEADADPGDRG
ncbi:MULTISPECIES: hypothetical protein [unclassified Kribbella]|uniref:hypothetical protein n=1 Tax=unclassified Kribbella TaxID=2644121 RepID=UPI00301629FC